MLPTASGYSCTSTVRCGAVSEAKKRVSRAGAESGSGNRCPASRPCSHSEREVCSAVVSRWWRRAVQPVVASITNTTARAASARQTLSCGEVSKEVTERTH